MALNWHHEALEQPDFHWPMLRRRLDGLTDDEYFWEPVPDRVAGHGRRSVEVALRRDLYRDTHRGG